ncbi:hypothetical protein HK101_009068, partial [Irineochytrium annulatum]
MEIQGEVSVDATAQPLPSFRYTVHNVIPGALLPIPYYDGCACASSGCDPLLCGCLLTHGVAYRIGGCRGTLDAAFPTDSPIYECNSRCSCPPDCYNRVVGSGAGARLRIAREDGRGLGLFAEEDIEAGRFVIEILDLSSTFHAAAGEVIRREEAKLRWASQREQGLCNYIICIREHGPSDRSKGILRTNIDPSQIGNAARFINHSCNPNLAFRTVRVDSPVPAAALFAVRDIARGEALSFGYGGLEPEGAESGIGLA